LIDLLPFSIKRIYFNEIKILLFCIIREQIEDQKIIKSLTIRDKTEAKTCLS